LKQAQQKNDLKSVLFPKVRTKNTQNFINIECLPISGLFKNDLLNSNLVQNSIFDLQKIQKG